jgi:hypothetical protein
MGQFRFSVESIEVKSLILKFGPCTLAHGNPAEDRD